MTQNTILSNDDNCLTDDEIKKRTSILKIMSTEEFQKCEDQFPYYKEMLRSFNSIRYCKAESFKDCIIGTFRLPQKKEEKTAAMTFGFYLTDQYIIFIENEGKFEPWFKKHQKILLESDAPDQLFLSVLEQMTEDDLLYLLHIETQSDKMEDDITNGITKDFFSTLTRYRQKLSELNSYYEQLVDIGEFFQSVSCRPIIQNEPDWDKFARHAERLQNHVNLIRENMLQLRELYQSVQDAKQNRIMGIITIVTTLFLPLTLLTGWYGMNFSNMPELKWRYGYVAMIVATLVILIVEFIYFKKKKFF